ncbi:type I restriction-modification system subunit S [Bifidobacterium porcinum]|nr:type I restriction-modification system subunit S [Bifidobacterium porcinum]
MCVEQEIPFEIPDSWMWTRLSELGEIVGGGTPKTGEPTFWDNSTNGIPWLTPADMSNVEDIYVQSGERYLSQTGLEKSSARLMPAGSVLMSSRAPIGYVAIASNPIATNQGFKSVVPYLLGINIWLYWCIQGRMDDIKRRASGTTFQEISGREFGMTLIPVPPLAEQERIAARVDELSPLVDEFGSLEERREALDSALPRKIRQSVLQEAVEGRLVEQNPADEPASVLLARIRDERRGLVAEGKLKFPKNGESVIYRASDGARYEKRIDAKGRVISDRCIQEEIPFDIPKTWEWARLGDVVNIVSAKRIHQSDWRSNGVPFYRAREIVKLSSGQSIQSPIFISEDTFADYAKYGRPMPGDLMVTGVGTIGTSYIVKSSDRFYYKDASVLCFENRMGMLSPYLQTLMKSPFMYQQIHHASSGTTVSTLTINNATTLLIPVPPLAEQRRIAAKVETALAVAE